MRRIIALSVAFVLLLLSCGLLCFINGIAVINGNLFSDNTDSEKNETDTIEYYVFENSIVKAENKLNPQMADYAVELFTRVNDELLSDSNEVYFAIIPDKEKLIEGNRVRYSEFYDYFSQRLQFATFVDLYPCLEFSDFYRTDPHLRQDRLDEVTELLLISMGQDGVSEYQLENATDDFKGAYSKASGFDVEKEELNYIQSSVIDNLKVSDGIELYNFKKLETDEPYEFFLSGNHPVLTITNKQAESDKHLVIFRDSFANNLAPLLCEDYSQVTLIDLRYIMSEYVGDMVDFENADVMFLYSTLLLNNSMSMK